MNNLADIVHKANAGLDKFTTTWGESQLENTQSIEKLQQKLQQLLESQKDKDKDTTDKGNNENDNSTKQSN
jgi:hypothetical protein